MSRLCEKDVYELLEKAHNFAKANSDCTKVQVGSALVSEEGVICYGANRGLGYSCKEDGCRRIKLYGEYSKNHRLPSDCNSVHSEVDVIAKCSKSGGYCGCQNAEIYVTRYPCEACARAIAVSGIKRVYYGRTEECSEYTKQILKSTGVDIIHVKDWIKEDVNV